MFSSISPRFTAPKSHQNGFYFLGFVQIKRINQMAIKAAQYKQQVILHCMVLWFLFSDIGLPYHSQFYGHNFWFQWNQSEHLMSLFFVWGVLSSYLESRVQRITTHADNNVWIHAIHEMGCALKIPNGMRMVMEAKEKGTEICHCTAQQWQNKQNFSSHCSCSVVAFNINLSLKQLTFHFWFLVFVLVCGRKSNL